MLDADGVAYTYEEWNAQDSADDVKTSGWK